MFVTYYLTILLSHLGQHVEGGHRVLELAAAVVGYPDALEAGLHRALGVEAARDALERHGTCRRLGLGLGFRSGSGSVVSGKG